MKTPFTASKTLFVTGFLLLAFNISFAQEDEEPPLSRSITSLDFQTQRPKTQSSAFSNNSSNSKTPKSAKRRKNIAALGSVKRSYKLVRRVSSTRKKVVSRRKKTKPVYVVEKLGVTFWRLRPPKSDEADAPTFPVENGTRREYWTAERVDSTTNFKKGDRVRFTVESPRNGYIYVVNREFYTDGSVAAVADLIFPTLKTRGGDNRVTQGTLIEIPPNNDVMSYFDIKPKRGDYAGEELYVIISPTKLPNIKIGLQAQEVPEKTLNKWLDDWSATVDIYDAEDGEGIAYTDTEAEAATVKMRSLRLSEPSPQTIYSVRLPKNQTLLVPFRLNASPK